MQITCLHPKKWIVIRLALFLVFLVYATNCLPQHRKKYSSVKFDQFTKFTNYGKTHGVSSYKISDIAQDGIGYIWIATREGLMRFDGESFITYKANGKSNSLPNDYVYTLAVDRTGKLWIGTAGGLCKYRPNTDDFEKVTQFFGTPFKNTDSWVVSILFDSKNNLWLDGYGGVLTQVNFNDQAVKVYQREFVENSIYPHHSIAEIDGYIFVGGANSLLYRLNKESGEFVKIPSSEVDGHMLHSQSASDIIEGPDTTFLWIANFADWAYKICKQTHKKYILPFRSAYSFLPIENNMLWVGGYSGGARLYNVETNDVTIFANNENNPYSIAGNQIRKIFRDKQGNIWFGTTSGISVLSAHKNRFKHIRKIPESNGLPSNRVRTLYADSSSTLWIGTENKGLVKYDLNSNSFRTYSHHTNLDSIGSNNITSIARYNDKSLLLSLWNGRGGAANQFFTEENRFKRFSTFDKYFWYGQILKHSNGSVWVGSWGGWGVMPLNLKEGDFKGRAFHQVGLGPSFGYDPTYPIDANGKGWVSFYPDRLINVLTGDSLTIINSETSSNINVGIPKKNSVIIDANRYTGLTKTLLKQNYYLGLMSDGRLVKINPTTREIEYPSKVTTEEVTNIIGDSLVYLSTAMGKLYQWDFLGGSTSLIIDNPIIKGATCLVQTSATTIVIGTDKAIVNIEKNNEKGGWSPDSILLETSTKRAFRTNGKSYFVTTNGLVEVDNKTLQIKTYFETSNVFSATPDSLNNLWVATNNGLFLLNLNTSEITEIKPEPHLEHGLPSKTVYALATDAKGDVWLSTSTHISRYCKHTQKFYTQYENTSTGLLSSLIWKMYEDSQGYLWVCSTKPVGIDRIDIRTGTVKHYPHKPFDKKSFPPTDATMITETAKGQILVATSMGLAIMQGRDNSFRLISKEDGLISNRIESVKEDSNGIIWLGTDRGLSSYNPNTKVINNYNPSEGVPDEPIYSIVSLGANRLAAGGYGGIVIFDPSKVTPDTSAIPLRITHYAIDGKTIEHHPQWEKSIVLKASHKTLDIGYAAFDYLSPENIRYAYILDGFDDSLIYANYTTKHIRYSNLPRGEYTFRVFCTNANGIWSSNPTELSVKVLPPFYFSWWFILLAITTSTAFVYAVISYREKWLKFENIKLESIVTERTNQISTKNAELKSQRDLIEEQANHIKRVNLHLIDSIEYAQSLQSALMPTSNEMESILGSHFLIFKPKDIVSGDFYWVNGNFEQFALVVADCTGHGVHGGFMSMMGLTFVAEAHKNPVNRTPQEILKGIHLHFTNTLKLDKKGATFTSGMDIAICLVNRNNGTVCYAGTGLPLYLLTRESDRVILKKYKSGAKPVGSPWFSLNVTNHEVKVKPGDRIFIPTDGAFDQLSVAERKRFSRKRFEELLRNTAHLSLIAQKEAINTELAKWQGNGIQTDDITLIGFVV